MALKFLNKKGWHTGSLRNIENVWKAEQKHDAEQKKLEELRKQIHEERERSEFRLLQEQAGLVPKQERLDFLYDSGLAVGKGSSSSAAGGSGAGGGSFKALEEALPSTKGTDASGNQSSAGPGALFEDKPHSANDAWRKLHSDPLLMIRQREQEALARIKNNPVQMAMIRKSAVEKKQKEKSEKSPNHKEHRKKHQHSSSKHRKHSSSKQHPDSEDDTLKEDKKDRNHQHKRSDYEGHYRRNESDSEDELKKTERQEKSHSRQNYGYEDQDAVKRNHDKSKRDKYSSQAPRSVDADKNQEKDRRSGDHESDSEDELKKTERQEKSRSRHKYGYDDQDSGKRNNDKSNRDKYFSQDPRNIDTYKNQEKDRQSHDHESDLKKSERQEKSRSRQKYGYDDQDAGKRNHGKSSRDKYSSQAPQSIDADKNQERRDKYSSQAPRNIDADKSQDKDRWSYDHRATAPRDDKRRGGTSKLSEEERAARLREMQEDAELHEEQRWKRLKKAEENDAREATVSSTSVGRNFLDAAHKSIYGAEKGGSSTIEESVRRRAHFSQGRYLSEGNAFRR